MEGFKQASEKEFIHSNKTLSYFTMKIEVARSNFALTPAYTPICLWPTTLSSRLQLDEQLSDLHSENQFVRALESTPSCLPLSVLHCHFHHFSELFSLAITCFNLSCLAYLIDISDLKCLMPNSCSSPQNLLSLVFLISVKGKLAYSVTQTIN